MAKKNEASFTSLAGVPVHYDRLASAPYGSDGAPRTFHCTQKLLDTLEACFGELFPLLPLGTPRLILTAGTLGDGENAHGKGLAFDLDGLKWAGDSLMMLDYPARRALYIGINAHMFLHFTQVLSWHYPRHKDHFHVDFNRSSHRYSTSSNAQTFFLQSAVKYIYGMDIGAFGEEQDGVDGVYGSATRRVMPDVLGMAGLAGQGGITDPAVWIGFLKDTRTRAFA